ncbi:hypothetical protein ANMWB30_24220 [Arthrobacter sp. MWB30]|nr:hypothetical protein ANMWB30_24220 [Arthrobacter sp. MWB30]
MKTQIVATGILILLGLAGCASQSGTDTQPPKQSGFVSEGSAQAPPADTVPNLPLTSYTEAQIAQVLEGMRGDLGSVASGELLAQKVKIAAKSATEFKASPEACRPFLVLPATRAGEALQAGLTAGVLSFGTDVPGQSSMLVTVDATGGSSQRFEEMLAAVQTCSTVRFSYNGRESNGTVQRLEPSAGSLLTLDVDWKTPGAQTTPQKGVWMFAHSGSVLIAAGTVLTSTTMNDVEDARTIEAAGKLKGKVIDTLKGFSELP